MWLPLSILYFLLLMLYRHGWRQIRIKLPQEIEPIKATVIIAARNEAENLPSCIESIQTQIREEDEVHIIVVDDHSEDETADIAKSIHGVRLESLSSGKGKKEAIQKGINAADTDILLFTDADCLPGPSWIQSMAECLSMGYDFVSGPVCLRKKNPGFLEQLQILEFSGLNAIGAAQIHLGLPGMANGASLAYKRDVFTEIGGFEGIESVASGDDDLLMQKFSKAGKKIIFCKDEEALVYTSPLKSLKDLLNQRRRWASKSRKYPDKKLSLQQVMVFAFYLAILIYAIAYMVGFQDSFWPVINMLFVKFLAEALLFRSIAKFYSLKGSGFKLLLGQIPQLLYVILIGVVAQFGTYEWKGRKAY